MTTPIGVGLIGAGKHGQRYAAHVARDVPGLALRALCRRDAVRGAAQAAELGTRFHADWRDLVADPAVDAVIVVVPPTLHRGIAEAVATARKALLIEAARHHGRRRDRDAPRASRRRRPLSDGARCAGIRSRAVQVAPVPALRAKLNQRFEVSTLDWLGARRSPAAASCSTRESTASTWCASSPGGRSCGFDAERAASPPCGPKTTSRRSSISRAAMRS